MLILVVPRFLPQDHKVLVFEQFVLGLLLVGGLIWTVWGNVSRFVADVTCTCLGLSRSARAGHGRIWVASFLGGVCPRLGWRGPSWRLTSDPDFCGRSFDLYRQSLCVWVICVPLSRHDFLLYWSLGETFWGFALRCLVLLSLPSILEFGDVLLVDLESPLCRESFSLGLRKFSLSLSHPKEWACWYR